MVTIAVAAAVNLICKKYSINDNSINRTTDYFFTNFSRTFNADLKCRKMTKIVTKRPVLKNRSKCCKIMAKLLKVAAVAATEAEGEVVVTEAEGEVAAAPDHTNLVMPVTGVAANRGGCCCLF